MDLWPPACCLLWLACGQADAGPREMTAEQWQQDLAWLAKKLPDKHGNAFHQVSRADFEAAVTRLDERIPSLARHEVLAELGRIVAMVGDGHTELWLPQEATGFKRLPIAVRYFGEDLYVFAATPDHADLLGRRVAGDRRRAGARGLRAGRSPLIGRDNEYEYRRSAPVYLMFPEILNAVGITPAAERGGADARRPRRRGGA